MLNAIKCCTKNLKQNEYKCEKSEDEEESKFKRIMSVEIVLRAVQANENGQPFFLAKE